MRRAIAILLLTIWVANFAGVSIYFAVQLHRQKKQMRALMAQLPKSELQKLSISLSEFIDLKVEEHELKVNGKMFDIAFTETSNEIINVYGLFDNDEDTILSSLKSEANKQTNDKSVNQVLKQFFSLQFVHEQLIINQSSFCVFKNYTHLIDSEVQYILHIDAPPPKEFLLI